MKKLSFLFFALIICILSVFKTNAQQYNTNKYAFQQNKKLGRGVNIIGYDPIWKDFTSARMKEKHFKMIREAGFNNVRIKVSPFSHSLKDSLFTIDPKFLTTLDWIIQKALDNHLMAIVDFHEHNAMENNPLSKKPMFLAMWKQIAEHCKNYSQEVVFEIANEPNMKPEIWNQIHAEAYQVIRKSNPNRTLLIGTIYGNQIQYLKDLVLPKEDRNIIVAVHYYSPIQFTHQGAPWSKKNKDLSGITWSNTPQEVQNVKADFDLAQQWSKANKRPITLGEFGVYEKADLDSRVRWTNYIARQAESRKWSWSYWQFDSDFIVFNMEKDAWFEPIKNALVPLSK